MTIGCVIYDSVTQSVISSCESLAYFSNEWFKGYLKTLNEIKNYHYNNVINDNGGIHLLLQPIEIVKTLDTKLIAILEDVIGRLNKEQVLSGNVVKKMILEYLIPGTYKTIMVGLYTEKAYSYYVMSPYDGNPPNANIPYTTGDLSTFLNELAHELAK